MLKKVDLRFKAMGCPCQILLVSLTLDETTLNEIAASCENTVRRYETNYSKFNSESILSKINQHAGNSDFLEVDECTAAILNYADVCYQLSDGLFDITSGALSSLWDFKSPSFIPSNSEISVVLKNLGWQHVEWESSRIRLPKNFSLDLGGVVKEYVVDVVYRELEVHGSLSALINFGGDIRVLGNNIDDKKNEFHWRIGISHPRKEGEALAYIDIPPSHSLVTSGDYERYKIIHGQRYCHIIDPLTGYPVNELQSVSVLAPLCTVAGSLSTIAFLKGHSGIQWLEETGVDFLIVNSSGIPQGSIAI